MNTSTHHSFHSVAANPRRLPAKSLHRSALVRGLRAFPVALGISLTLGATATLRAAAPALIDWGATNDTVGLLGTGTVGGSSVPVAVDTSGVLAGKTITAVSPGNTFCLALDSAGKVYSWGSNANGQLGNTSIPTGFGAGNYSASPVAVDTSGDLNGKTVTAIAAGVQTALVLTSDGKLYSWGRDYLGDGTGNESHTPVAVDMSGALNGKTVTAIAAGGTFWLVLTSEGKVYTWGDNGSGELGTNAGGLFGQYSFVPVAVDASGVLAGKTITAIAAGATHSLVLTSDNKLFTWGYESHALGAGSGVVLQSNGAPSAPVAVDMSGVLSGRTVTQIAAGQNFCVVLTSDGKVFTWGYEGNGNLGNGTTGYLSSQYTAVAVDMTGVLAGLSVTAISCDTTTVVIQASDGKLYAWGDNTQGQLGVTGIAQANVPVAVDATGPLGGHTVTALQTGSGGGEARTPIVIATAVTSVAPSITTQPLSQTVTAGSSASFTVAAGGTPTPTYQWQKGGVDIAGATSATYTIASVVAGDAGNFTAVASNSAGSATSSPATLTVNAAPAAPAITTQPVSQTVAPGAAVSFTVTASGNPAPTFQWQKGGADIAGATSATFSIASVAAGDAGSYTAVATNSSGSATSSAATLTVSAATSAPVITTQPTSQAVTAGSAVSFTVTASGNPTPTFQWQKGGVDIAGATSATYTIAGAVAGDAGSYTAVATNSAGSATSSAATLTVNVAMTGPVITSQPVSQTVTAGGSVSFSVSASGNPAPAFQWYFGGAAIPGATGNTFTIGSTAGRDAGAYSVVVANAAGSVTSTAATLVVLSPRLINLSSRAACGTGNNVTIGGVVISGVTPKKVLVRAVGPTLSGLGLSSAEVLSDPVIEVHDMVHGSTPIASNDNWGDNANAAEITSVAAQVGAIPLAADDTKSAALLLTLNPGVYTFVASGKGGATGVVLLELYDADSTASDSSVVNFATRAHTTTGNGVTIGGFVISGNAPKQILLRGVGPTLTGVNQTDVLADPVIELHDALHGNATIATNDNWSDNANAALITSTALRIGALPLAATDTKSAALLLTLQPGVYTFIVSDKNASSGIVLIEVYDAD